MRKQLLYLGIHTDGHVTRESFVDGQTEACSVTVNGQTEPFEAPCDAVTHCSVRRPG